MKNKLTFGTIAVLFALLFLGGCKEKEMKSLTQLIKEEKGNISSFINEQGFSVKEASGEETSFEKNILYHFPNGLYMYPTVAGLSKGRPVLPSLTSIIPVFG